MKINILKKFTLVFVLVFVFFFFKNVAQAANTDLNVLIRNGANVIYNGVVPLPASGDISIPNIPDDNNGTHSVDADSVLGVIYKLDQTDDSFAISNLSYNTTYSSFLLNCLTPTGESSLCYDWRYAVGDSSPSVGMDKYILSGGESIYLFFGPQNKVILSDNSITTKDTLTVTTEKYNYINNTWEKRPGVTVGLTTPNPDDPFSPNDDIKKLVNSTTAQATFSNIPAGTYKVGVKEDYYWPTTSLTVTTPPIITGAGTGSLLAPHSTPSYVEVITPEKKDEFSVPKALDFLLKNQKDDGSFNTSMYTDWVAMASAAAADPSLEEKLSTYLRNNPLDSYLLTDNERHAMALMSLNINPYSSTPVNYIKKIVDSFDGVQFGNKDLVNDDIFALIVLKNVGFKEGDYIISNDVKYIVSQQETDGSWGSVDLTAAAIQALRRLNDLPGVRISISKATDYLLKAKKSDGGFGNSFSTSWVLQTFPNDSRFTSSQKVLYLDQQEDGGLDKDADINSRILATAYAIPAILHEPWSLTMHRFPKAIFPGRVIEKVISTSKSIIEKTPVKKVKETPIKKRVPKINISQNNKPKLKIKTVKIEKEKPTLKKKPVLINSGAIKKKNSSKVIHKRRSLFSRAKSGILYIWHKLGF